MGHSFCSRDLDLGVQPSPGSFPWLNAPAASARRQMGAPRDSGDHCSSNEVVTGWFFSTGLFMDMSIELGARTLLGAPGHTTRTTTRSKKLLGAKGIATRSKESTFGF